MRHTRMAHGLPNPWVKREMEIMSSFCYTSRQDLLMNGKKRALVHLSHQSLRGTLPCGVQLVQQIVLCYVY